MTPIKCEICNSNNIVKQDGLYVCQNCGAKYTVEELKKLIGTVKIDVQDTVRNMYETARRAKDNDNTDLACKYYTDILKYDPSSWEATFYSTYYTARNCTIGEIPNSIVLLSNCYNSVFNLLKDSNLSDDDNISAIVEIASKTFDISNLFFSGTMKLMPRPDYNDLLNSSREFSEWRTKIEQTTFPVEKCGDEIYTVFEDHPGYLSAAVSCWKFAINRRKQFIDATDEGIHGKKRDLIYDKSNFQRLIDKIRLVEPNYEPDFTVKDIEETKKETKKGCYIATCVYGSYNCPEVWMLRRYRDNYLSNTKLGRAFIKAYYCISPKLVKFFGDEKWFRHIFKSYLDYKVEKLKNNGYSSEPYKDI